MVVQGWWVSGAQKTTEDYFVGGRQMSWLAVGVSMFAATFSPLSFVGLPREAAYDNYHLYLAILFIPLVVAPLVGWLFVPLYHRLKLTSAYEYLELRFDRRLRRCGSFLMGVYILAWMGSMLYAVGLIVQVAFELGEAERIVTMILLGGATTAYTTLGGYKAAVWTNVLKAAFLATVIVAVLFLAVARIDGGWANVWRLGLDHDKFAMFVSAVASTFGRFSSSGQYPFGARFSIWTRSSSNNVRLGAPRAASWKATCRPMAPTPITKVSQPANRSGGTKSRWRTSRSLVIDLVVDRIGQDGAHPGEPFRLCLTAKLHSALMRFAQGFLNDVGGIEMAWRGAQPDARQDLQIETILFEIPHVGRYRVFGHARLHKV
jgi:hypothetical protein